MVLDYCDLLTGTLLAALLSAFLSTSRSQSEA